MDAPLADISALHGASLEVIQSSGSLIANTSSGFFSDPSLGSLQCNVSSAIYRSDSFGVASGGSPSGMLGNGNAYPPMTAALVDDYTDNPHVPSVRTGGDIVASLVDEEATTSSNYAPSSVGQYTVRGAGGGLYTLENDGYTSATSAATSVVHYQQQSHHHHNNHTSSSGLYQHPMQAHISSGSSTPSGYGGASSVSTNVPLPHMSASHTHDQGPYLHQQYSTHQHQATSAAGMYGVPPHQMQGAADGGHYGHYAQAQPDVHCGATPHTMNMGVGYGNMPPTPPFPGHAHLAHPYTLNMAYRVGPQQQQQQQQQYPYHQSTASTCDVGAMSRTITNDSTRAVNSTMPQHHHQHQQRPSSSRFGGFGYKESSRLPHAYASSSVSLYSDARPTSGVYMGGVDMRGGPGTGTYPQRPERGHYPSRGFGNAVGNSISRGGDHRRASSNAGGVCAGTPPKTTPNATVSDSLPFVVGGYAFPGGLNRKERRRILFLNELDEEALAVAVRVPDGWAPRHGLGDGSASQADAESSKASPAGEGTEGGGPRSAAMGDEKSHPQMRPYVNITLEDFVELRRIVMGL